MIRCKVYKIECACGCNRIYIGSTKQPTLAKRMAIHRSAARSSRSKSKLHNHMRDVGLDKFTIHLIEIKEVTDRDAMRQLEDKYIRELDTINVGLNEHRAYLTEEDKKEYIRQYNEANKEQIKERNKLYNEINKERNKRYNEITKERIRRYNKEYGGLSRDEIKQRREAKLQQIKLKYLQYYKSNLKRMEEFLQQYRQP